MVHLLPVPNMEWAVYELCIVPALGTPKTARVGSMGVVASQDPTPRGGWGDPLLTPKRFYATMGVVDFGGHLLN